jgi:chorismate synthase
MVNSLTSYRSIRSVLMTINQIRESYRNYAPNLDDSNSPSDEQIIDERSELTTKLSGVFEGKTTGTPLCIMLNNTDMRPESNNDIKHSIRPGHADFTYLKKYGFRDYMGSGRASGRETTARVAAGAVARKFLENRGVSVIAYTTEVGGIKCQIYDEGSIEKNAVRACDSEAAIK